VLSKLAGKGIPVVITNRGGMGRVRDTRADAADELQRIFDEY